MDVFDDFFKPSNAPTQNHHAPLPSATRTAHHDEVFNDFFATQPQPTQPTSIRSVDDPFGDFAAPDIRYPPTAEQGAATERTGDDGFGDFSEPTAAPPTEHEAAAAGRSVDDPFGDFAAPDIRYPPTAEQGAATERTGDDGFGDFSEPTAAPPAEHAPPSPAHCAADAQDGDDGFGDFSEPTAAPPAEHASDTRYGVVRRSLSDVFDAEFLRGCGFGDALDRAATIVSAECSQNRDFADEVVSDSAVALGTSAEAILPFVARAFESVGMVDGGVAAMGLVVGDPSLLKRTVVERAAGRGESGDGWCLTRSTSFAGGPQTHTSPMFPPTPTDFLAGSPTEESPTQPRNVSERQLGSSLTSNGDTGKGPNGPSVDGRSASLQHHDSSMVFEDSNGGLGCGDSVGSLLAELARCTDGGRDGFGSLDEADVSFTAYLQAQVDAAVAACVPRGAATSMGRDNEEGGATLRGEQHDGRAAAMVSIWPLMANGNVWDAPEAVLPLLGRSTT